MKWLFSTKALLVVSFLMMFGGITLDILAWMHVVAKNEPPLVVHLSTAALYFSGYGNVIAASINKQIKEN